MIEYTDEQHDSLIRGHRKQLRDAQATVEALQRENECKDTLIETLHAQVNAEREKHHEYQVFAVGKVAEYEAAKQALLEVGIPEQHEIGGQLVGLGLYGRIKDLAAQLTQLQALVRALLGSNEKTYTVAYYNLYHYFHRATLDATTPATDTSIIGKREPPSQWNQNAQVRGDIS
ncbi:MAG: hypothetical protein HQL97_10670 [Magnetococcales bacterium]|nr:hypothetical protein [Magnetococcales bacterium]